MVTLPLVNDSPHFDFQCELDGVTYGFEFRWNTRDTAWFMSIFTGDDTLILARNKLVANYVLMLRSVDARLPPGKLIVLDTTGSKLDPGLTDLGARVLLVYASASEVAVAEPRPA